MILINVRNDPCKAATVADLNADYTAMKLAV